ncbi:hypothetical protein PIB30_075587, partial [Stylosanthes scabra]|nr:hypothetical protein [Stylosanthes scabra]
MDHNKGEQQWRFNRKLQILKRRHSIIDIRIPTAWLCYNQLGSVNSHIGNYHKGHVVQTNKE